MCWLIWRRTQLRIEGLGKATRYVVNVPGWEQPALKQG